MITKKLFDTYNGQDVYAYTITDGIEVTVCTLGATVLALKVPDRKGEMTDVALGMTTARDVIEKGDYMGAVVGRCANRIANGQFMLNGTSYRLAKNNGNAHLHGGKLGFNCKVFDATVEGNSLVLTTVSPDGDEGYSGELTLTVKYTVTGSSGSILKIEYFAQSNKDTLFNPTNHTYFNLNGESDGSILDNCVKIYADEYLQVNEDLIPTVRARVEGTPFDFRRDKPIGQDIHCNDLQLRLGGGYDHCFCLRDNYAAYAYSQKTGIAMTVLTDMPGIQLYTGNFLCGNVGKSVYNKHSGFCLETQFFPNAINRNDCAKPILKAGEKFYSCTKYSFSHKMLEK